MLPDSNATRCVRYTAAFAGERGKEKAMQSRRMPKNGLTQRVNSKMAESVDAPVVPSVVVANSAVSNRGRISFSNLELNPSHRQPSSASDSTFLDSNGRLLEDSTPFELVPSLEKAATQLEKNANHHDHLVALSILVMGEMGFRVNEPVHSRKERENIDETLKPAESRCDSGKNTSYQLKFKHESGNDCLDCKLVAVPIGDVLVINLCPSHRGNGEIVTRTRNLAFSSFKYINPYSSDLTGRFMNLREFSHRFKDNLATPMKGEILTNAGITNASLSGLPTELKINILRILKACDIRRMAQCSREFRDLCATLRR